LAGAGGEGGLRSQPVAAVVVSWTNLFRPRLLDQVGAYEPDSNIAPLADDVEGSRFDIGTTSIRLVRVGNTIQILFSNPLEAKILYKELAERYKRDEGRLKAG
jgi:hypothetical protein